MFTPKNIKIGLIVGGIKGYKSQALKVLRFWADRHNFHDAPKISHPQSLKYYSLLPQFTSDRP